MCVSLGAGKEEQCEDLAAKCLQITVIIVDCVSFFQIEVISKHSEL